MRKLSGFWNKVIIALSIMLVVFQMYTAGFGVFPDIIQRSVHLFLLLPMIFITKPIKKNVAMDHVPIYDIIIALTAMFCCGYLLLIYKQILWDPSQWISPIDMVCSILLTLIIIEGARRAVGITFPIMALFFLFYAFFGQIFPGDWGHKNYTFDQIFQNLYHTTNGIWGQMVGLSAGMLAMFGIFGAVLSITGGSETFINIAAKLTGKTVGGPAKVALIASGLFGMVSGSAMANVVATGTFTIPSMKKAGYDKEWSASICAVGSTGGQIMPPIMGAGAFIMAQLLGISYLSIAKAAIMPALLYYMGAFVAIHYLSKKLKIYGDPSKEKIGAWELAIIFVPLGIFIVFLAMSYTVTKAAFYATILAIVVTAVSYVAEISKARETAKKADEKVGVHGSTKVDVHGFTIDSESSIPRESARMTGKLIYDSAIEGASSILSMAGLLAGAQISIALISFTGFGVKLSNMIISVGSGHLFLCLLLAMVVCFILGMGLPPTAAYVLAAAILAPALISLGVPALSAHLFVFYFSTIGAITPPVCAAVFLSSNIAESNWLKTGGLSVLIAIPAFVVPYTFAYNQALMLDGGIFDIVSGVITAAIGVWFIGISIAGYTSREINLAMRALLFVSGILMVIPNNLSSLIGLVIGVIAFVLAGGLKKDENKPGKEQPAAQ